PPPNRLSVMGPSASPSASAPPACGSGGGGQGVGVNGLQSACSCLALTFAFVAPSTRKPAKPPPHTPGTRLFASLPTATPNALARRATRASGTTAARSHTRAPGGVLWAGRRHGGIPVRAAPPRSLHHPAMLGLRHAGAHLALPAD